MKILLDLQGAQSLSRERGIGRATRSLALALLAAPRGHEFHALVSEDLPDGLDALCADLAAFLPRERIHSLGPFGRVAEREPANAWRARSAALLREARIAALAPDLVHVGSVFEGHSDDAVCSIGRLDTRHATSVVLHDLIPLAKPDAYLADPFYRAFYLRHAQDLKRADLLLAVSEHSRRDAVARLHVPADRIVVAPNGIDAQFRPPAFADGEAEAMRARLGIRGRFLLHVGAADPRKNVSLLIEAFGRLPAELRAGLSLLLVGRLSDAEREAVAEAARRFGVNESELIETGYVSDADLAALYGLCEALVMPSTHEGFGLPPAEAMACGAPILAADATSLPEVVGRTDCLFDPADAGSLADRIVRLLNDDAWRADLRRHGPERAAAFTWAQTARLTLDAFEAIRPRAATSGAAGAAIARRKRLAFVSPLPPDETGIADYSADLLRELLVHYEIDCVLPAGTTDDPWVAANCGLRTVAWFVAHADQYDRILYSVGNSYFHVHMLGLLARHPGTVILHDVYLSDLALDMLRHAQRPTEPLIREIYRSHGLTGLRMLQEGGMGAVVDRMSLLGPVVRNAQGVVVHSRFAERLVRDSSGCGDQDVAVLPLLRGVEPIADRAAARAALGLAADDFIVCSFGVVHPRKMHRRVAEAFLASGLAADPTCRLLIVGDENAAYSGEIMDIVSAAAPRATVRFTARVDAETYRLYMEAADVAVQLRTESRGETSRAMLDAMAYGLPTIVTAIGAAAELPDGAVIAVPVDVSAGALAAILDGLRTDAQAIPALGRRAREAIGRVYHPVLVAKQLRDLIERFTEDSPRHAESIVRDAAADLDAGRPALAPDLDRMAGHLRALFPAPRSRQILCDVSSIATTDRKTGIERVVRAVLERLVAAPPPGFRVEPVIIKGDGPSYARQFSEERLGLDLGGLPSAPVEFGPGDHFLGLDWTPDRLPAIEPWLARFRRGGGTVTIVVYDLLPLEQPHHFPDWLEETERRWFELCARRADHFACISRAVADSVATFATPIAASRPDPLTIGHFHLGHDIAASRPSTGLSPRDKDHLARMAGRPTFLAVGTVEPRKGHGQLLAAFASLWAHGHDLGLAIVGREGWMVEDIASAIRSSPEADDRLLWLPDASDEMLDRLYGSAAALVAPSLGEGFGLPLVEAAGHGLPVIARDLAVFREVGGRHAFYFSGEAPNDLADAILGWLRLCDEGQAPSSAGMRRLTWDEATDDLLRVMMGERSDHVLAAREPA